MCGIIGYNKGLTEERYDNPVKPVHNGLKRMVYRGYDSWGIATEEKTLKKTGEVPEILEAELGGNRQAAIGHTRWATHGGVTGENAHPHESCDGRFAVVHNGIIENHETIKEDILEEHSFTSETDTEVIPHMLEHYIDDERTVAEALFVVDKQLVGNYAIVVLDRETEQMYGLKQGSPLIFAYPMTNEEGPIEHPIGGFFASDLYALSDKAEKAYFMEDGDIIKTSGSNLALMENGEWQTGLKNSNWKEFEWTEEEPVLDDEHEYWMEKEIEEIPEALRNLEKSLQSDQKKEVVTFKKKIEEADKVLFTASGSSYHATLLGVYFLQRNGVDAQTLIASEFENYERITEDTVVIAVSQSGETRDVLEALSVAREKDATILSLVNTPHSTIQRESETSLEIKAGQERCVAATKTFTNQVYTLMHLAGENHLGEIPDKLENQTEDIQQIATEDAGEFYLDGHEDLYIIGTGETYPLAREIALKTKEISYIHAEGMMAGELKHGTLAMIEEGTPVIALDNGTGNILNSVEEVEARGGRTKTLKNTDDDPALFVFTSAIYGFRLALTWAHMKDLPVDRPRNLAKSVTVK